MRHLGFVPMAAMLAGCAGIVRPEPAPVALTPAEAAVAVLAAMPQDAVAVGTVSATTCLNQLWQSRPGWDVAMDELKKQAAVLGATALTDIRYEDGRARLCPSSLKLTAVALKTP